MFLKLNQHFQETLLMLAKRIKCYPTNLQIALLF